MNKYQRREARMLIKANNEAHKKAWSIEVKK